jgi:hypothetical protein
MPEELKEVEGVEVEAKPTAKVNPVTDAFIKGIAALGLVYGAADLATVDMQKDNVITAYIQEQKDSIVAAYEDKARPSKKIITDKDSIFRAAKDSLVTVAVFDTLGDSVGTKKEMRTVLPRLVKNSDNRVVYPNVTIGDETFKIIYIATRPGIEPDTFAEVINQPAKGRWVVGYTTTTEK